MKNEEIVVSAPGRICLSGEHQDYFDLPIIAAAINLRVKISGKKNHKNQIRIDLPDVGETEDFPIGKELEYHKQRDYLKSAVNVLQRKGITFPGGWDCLIKGTIPINSGTASSSALVVAWVKFILEAVQNDRASVAEILAEWGFEAEVAEFKEPGGKMDHYSSAVGGIIMLHFGDTLQVKRLKNPLKEFVLADSLIKKNSTGTLGYIKNKVIQGIVRVQKKIIGFSLRSPLKSHIRAEIDKLPDDMKKLLKGTFMSRDLTAEGETLFESESFNHERFGLLLSRQQEVLRDYLHVSLPKINRMVDACLDAGALGAKINGSGEGGCIFAYCPNRSEQVSEAMKKMGAKAYIIQIDEGARREN